MGMRLIRMGISYTAFVLQQIITIFRLAPTLRVASLGKDCWEGPQLFPLPRHDYSLPRGHGSQDLMANPIPLQERLVFPYLRVPYSEVTGLKNVETTGDRVDASWSC